MIIVEKPALHTVRVAAELCFYAYLPTPACQIQLLKSLSISQTCFYLYSSARSYNIPLGNFLKAALCQLLTGGSY